MACTPSTMEGHTRAVRLYSLVLLPVSVVFWLWAVVNSIRGRFFDSGNIVFAVSGVAAVLGVKATASSYSALESKPSPGERKRLARLHSLWMKAGVCLVSLAYAAALGLVWAGKLGDRARRGHYLVVFGLPLLLWLTVGSYCAWLAHSYDRLCNQ